MMNQSLIQDSGKRTNAPRTIVQSKRIHSQKEAHMYYPFEGGIDELDALQDVQALVEVLA